MAKSEENRLGLKFVLNIFVGSPSTYSRYPIFQILSHKNGSLKKLGVFLTNFFIYII